VSNARENVIRLNDSVSADNGDADATLVWGEDETTQVWATTLTVDRTVTLSTTNAVNGARFHILRTLAATGDFDLSIGTGPLITLPVGNEWCDVQYDGSAWIVVAYGTIYVAP
jgi:hypothetical protein